MAARYWVGGNANWDATAGTKWALTSGGAGGQAVPTSADAVFLDNGTGTGNVTITSLATCLSLNCTGYINTLTKNVQINCYGSVTLGIGMTIAGGGSIVAYGSGTYTSNGISWLGAFQTINTNTTTFADNWTFTGYVANAGTTTINGSTIYITGIFTIAGSVSGTTNIILSGTSTWSGTGNIRTNITINTSGTITISGVINYYTGTLTYTAGTVVTTGSALTIAASTTLNTNGINWAGLTTTGTITVTLSSNLTVNTELRHTGTTTQVTYNGNTIYIGGNITFPGTAGIIQGTANIIYNGTGTWAATTNSTCSIRNNFTINTAGTLTLGNGVQALGYNTGTLTYVAGTLVLTNSGFFCNTNTTLDWQGQALRNVAFANATITLLSNFSTTGLLSNTTVTYVGVGVWTANSFSITTAGAIVTLVAGQTYTIQTAMTGAGTNASHTHISSSDAILVAYLILQNGATQDNSFLNGTRIDSSGGKMICSYKGILTTTTNWRNLPTQTPTTSY